MDRKQYESLIGPAIALVVKKHEDYNTGIKLEDYFPFQDKSYIQMLHTKVLRLRSLETKPGNKANFESVQDTLYDLINYSVFYLAFLEGAQVK